MNQQPSGDQNRNLTPKGTSSESHPGNESLTRLRENLISKAWDHFTSDGAGVQYLIYSFDSKLRNLHSHLDELLIMRELLLPQVTLQLQQKLDELRRLLSAIIDPDPRIDPFSSYGTSSQKITSTLKALTKIDLLRAKWCPQCSTAKK